MARFGVLLLAGLLIAGCSGSRGSKAEPAGDVTSNPATTTSPTGSASGVGKIHRLASGLVYQDVVIGNGKMADPGLAVSVHYTGWLTDGTEFDSSVRRGQPLQFTLGSGRVIQGWEEGIKGMRVGGKRKLTIPPDLGYGAEGYGGGLIPPNATLQFDIELLSVK
jgi:FKBP-type peptidyl-prolyl cis-trans isomerase